MWEGQHPDEVVEVGDDLDPRKIEPFRRILGEGGQDAKGLLPPKTQLVVVACQARAVHEDRRARERGHHSSGTVGAPCGGQWLELLAQEEMLSPKKPLKRLELRRLSH